MRREGNGWRPVTPYGGTSGIWDDSTREALDLPPGEAETRFRRPQLGQQWITNSWPISSGVPCSAPAVWRSKVWAFSNAAIPDVCRSARLTGCGSSSPMRPRTSLRPSGYIRRLGPGDMRPGGIAGSCCLGRTGLIFVQFGEKAGRFPVRSAVCTRLCEPTAGRRRISDPGAARRLPGSGTDTARNAIRRPFSELRSRCGAGCGGDRGPATGCGVTWEIPDTRR
jgi:hypothetical protein